MSFVPAAGTETDRSPLSPQSKVNEEYYNELAVKILEGFVTITVGSKEYDIDHISTEYDATSGECKLNIHAK